MPNVFQPLGSRYGTTGTSAVNPFLRPPAPGGTFGNNPPLYPDWASVVGGTTWENNQRVSAATTQQRQKAREMFGDPPMGVDPDQWYRQKEAEAQHTPIKVVKNPWLKDFVGGLQTDLSKASATMPDFTQFLNSLKTNQTGINTAFDRYGAAMNLDDYSGAQRGGDAELRVRTGALAGDVGAMSSRYDDVLADYERRGLGALNDYSASASDFTNRLVPEGVRLGQAGANRYMSKWQMGQDGGGSSAGIRLASQTATESALPWLLRGNEAEREALGRYQPFYGDVASRQAGKITGFDYPAAAAMYDRYGNVIGQEKATAANIQQLQMSVAREGVDMAIKRFVTDFQSAQMLAQAANLPVEVILQRAQAAGALGGMSPLYQYEGLQGPQAFLQSPTGQNNSLPGYPQSRYNNTQTGTQGNAQERSGPNAAGWQDWQSYFNRDPKQFQQEGRGVYDLPNDFTWGRNAAQQRDFESVQRSYE